mmetsp:Transcript_30065/g.52801  ORF Transcript_30065/g.52801 Transcript_30065/m.52801 type:complete len:371 (+) Transcript_30065:301-1413(+)
MRVSVCNVITLGSDNSKVSKHVLQCIHSLLDHLLIMERPRREPVPLRSDGHSRVVDRLDVYAIFLHKHVSSFLAQLGITDHHRDNVALRRQERDSPLLEMALKDLGSLLLEVSFYVAFLEVFHASQRPSGDGRRYGGCEDEPGCEAADGIHYDCWTRDVTSVDSVGLAQCSGDDGYSVREAAHLGHSAALLSVEAYSVHLIDEGQRAVLVCEVTDFFDGRYISVHGVNAFENDELVSTRVGRRQQVLEVLQVVVSEDVLGHPGVADALDHRGMVVGVGEDLAVGEVLGDGGDGRLVCDESRRKHQRRLFVVDVRQLSLQKGVVDCGARDVTGSPGPGATCAGGLAHGVDDLWVLAHTQVIVVTPNLDGLL